MAATHREALEHSLGSDSSRWEWVPRRNAAMRFPTDFALVRIPGDADPLKVGRPQKTSCRRAAVGTLWVSVGIGKGPWCRPLHPELHPPAG